MEIQIRGNNIQITDRIRSEAERHAARLDRLVDRVVDAKLELRHLRQRSGPDVIVAQVTLQTGKQTLRAEEHDPDAVRAVDLAMEKLDRQVRKVHERRADRFGRRIPAESIVSTEPPTVESDNDEVLVRTKRFPVKPMDTDEAIEQMELLGHDFFLFQNTDAGSMSVLYKRKDGSYGLLIPEPM